MTTQDKELRGLIGELRRKPIPLADIIPTLQRAADRIDRLEAENERAQEAFHQIKAWSEAYPLSVFPEPDFQKAHEVLTANGMTLDAISASNMRHVITKAQAIVDAVITTRKETP